MGDIGRALVAIAASAFALATASVIFSQRSQASTVITSGGNAFASILNAATSPVTGATSASTAAGTAASALGGVIDSGAFNL
jgi:hypothetical protein